MTKAKELSPEEVVVVYHAIHLLLVACGNSKKLMKLFQENFTEEIRCVCVCVCVYMCVCVCVFAYVHACNMNVLKSKKYTLCLISCFRYFLRISIFTRIIPDNILLKQKIIEELQELKSMVLTLQ